MLNHFIKVIRDQLDINTANVSKNSKPPGSENPQQHMSLFHSHWHNKHNPLLPKLAKSKVKFLIKVLDVFTEDRLGNCVNHDCQ